MIEKIAKKRDIRCLWHFTRLDNLEAILENGLVPRSVLEENQEEVIFNDEYRLDGQKDAICFSIGHPNYKMFYSLRTTHKDIDWIVLACDPEILWVKDCAFCIENAASNNVTKVELQDRKGAEAFEKLFEEIDGKPSREDLGISEFCPTNPQAEILVFDRVEPEFIGGICCETTKEREDLREVYPEWQIEEVNGVFRARKDYKHWK